MNSVVPVAQRQRRQTARQLRLEPQRQARAARRSAPAAAAGPSAAPERRRSGELLAASSSSSRSQRLAPTAGARCHTAKSAYCTGSARQRSQRPRPGERRRVERRHLPHQHPHRPAVRDDVVHGRAAARVSRSASRSSVARSSGPRGEIERAQRLLRHPPRELPPALALRASADRSIDWQREGRAVAGCDPPAAVRPSPATNVVRSVSWRRTSSPRHRRERLRSSSPCERAAPSGMLYSRAPRLELIEEPQPPLRERRRERAAALRVARQGDDRRLATACASSPEPARSTARPATVGCSKSARTGSSTPSRSRSRETTWVASSECPPRAKKLSCTPTRSRREQVAPDPRQHLLRRRARRLVRRRPLAVSPGAGSALRSTFPVGVSGSAASSTHVDGTMNDGRREPR